MKYDFVLFEHLYNVQNHYKDLSNLAVLLKTAGYKVAIADAFKEAELCKVEGVPHISIDIKCPKEFRTPRTYEHKELAFKKFYNRIRKDIYMYKVVKKLNDIAPNIYAGSLTLATPVFFMNAFDNSSTNYYMWALRSSHVLKWKNGIKSFSSLVSKLLYDRIFRHSNLRLLISNQLIRQEFLENVGLNQNKLILRPERFLTQKVPNKNVKPKDRKLQLLFIGTLRPFKNVEFCIEALKKINAPGIFYTIAGRCKIDEAYNKKIEKLIRDMPNVRRIDRYIPEEEYMELIKECDFLILCDKTQASCASNGTMSESLLMGKPIIAPNINPFKYEVETYGVGYLYNYGDLDSLCSLLLYARDQGTERFQEVLASYQDMFMLDRVAENLKEQI